MGVMITALLIIFILVCSSSFYRWAFFPKRKPDFEHRLYVYWFDEKVAYSKLASKKRLKFYELNGTLYEDLGYGKARTDRKLPIEVQDAYESHLDKKFEEIILL